LATALVPGTPGSANAWSTRYAYAGRVGEATTLFTIGFTRTTARRFFERLRDAEIERVVDVRLNNSSQLAGFAKAGDLPYFLETILGATYAHEPLLAPTPELLARGRNAKTAKDWDRFEREFLRLMRDRAVQEVLVRSAFDQERTALLCSEATADRCHRRLVGSYLRQYWPDLSVTDL
jgi:uncharacterized protein (DUF488 family)